MWKFSKFKQLASLQTEINSTFNLLKPFRHMSISSFEFHSLIDIESNVREKLSSGKPVVALESTIITHGMPYPYNLETALEVEDCIKLEGSTPATIAIIDGRIKVGLKNDELKRLASFSNDTNSSTNNIIKCSRRDLAYAASKKLCGGTTVAGTLIIANKIGIKIFATGGIGGVHRDAQETFDISADLMELGRTPIAVICSGIKSILDIPKTLEFLETQGVFVAAYQSSEFEFPAFYTRSSGCKVPYNLGDSKEAANLIKSSLELKLNSGILIGVPIPHEHAAPEKLINDAIESALSDAKKVGISGKQVTPFVLEAVSRITKGKSLNSNIALIKHNAKIASQIAVQLYKIYSSDINYAKIQPESAVVYSNLTTNIKGFDKDPITHKANQTRSIPIVIGASVLDITMKIEEDYKMNGATYSVKNNICSGGVGRNIAEGLWKLYGNVNLISVIGNDDIGKNMKNKLPSECTKGVVCINDQMTSLCSVILDRTGDCKIQLGNFEIHNNISPSIINKYKDLIINAPLIILDANLTIQSTEKILELSRDHNIPVFFEPSDMTIAHKPFSLPATLTKQIKFISPNIYELQTILNAVKKRNLNIKFSKNKIEMINTAKELLNEIQDHFDCIILTLGSFGVIINGQIDMEHTFFDENYVYKENKTLERKNFYLEAPKIDGLRNVSGAGDSFCSGFITAMLKQYNLHNCISYGFAAAKDSLLSDNAVPDHYKCVKDITIPS